MMGVRGWTPPCFQRLPGSPACERSGGEATALFAVVGTRRPGQDSVSVSVSARAERSGAEVVNAAQPMAASLVHQNSVPSSQMQRRITASLRAIATFAFLAPMRLASFWPHAFSGDQRLTLLSSTLA